MSTTGSTASPPAEDLFGCLTPVSDETRSRLHEKLVEAAAREGVLDVAYRLLDSPLGPLLLASTDAGLVRVAFARQGHDEVLQTLAAMISPRVLEAPGRLDPVARELGEYFEGRRAAFDVPLDLRLARGFRRDVLRHLSDIAYGTTASYASVASAAGHPRAARAVGSACRTNPLPLVVPCHRVLRSDGRVGEYVGGTDAKRALLRLEGAVAGAP